MDDLNCPSCGTTQPKIAPGCCECCGYEFTVEFITNFKKEQQKKDDEIKRKLAEEERKKRILRIKEEKELEAKRKAESEANRRAIETAKKERAEREKLRKRLEKEKERYNKELRFSVSFKKFRKFISTSGLILTAICLVLSFISVNAGNASPISPKDEVNSKIQSAYYANTYPVKYDEKSDQYNIVKKSKAEIRLSIGTIKLLNSVSSIINNRSSFQEKMYFTFPHISSLIGIKTDSDYLIDNANLFSDSEKEELVKLLADSRNENSFDIVILTTTDFEGKSAQQYAEDYFDSNNFGHGKSKDGCIFVINSKSKEWYISTSGFGVETLNKKEIKTISKKFSKYLKSKKYFSAGKSFIKQTDKIVAKARN